MKSVVLLVIVLVMWILFLGILIGVYFFMSAARKKRVAKEREKGTDGQAKAPVFTQIYLLLLFLAMLVFTMKYLRGSLYRIAVPVMALPLLALYRIRKKPEHDAFVFVASFILILGGLMTAMIVGLPPKRPALVIGQTEIVAGRTTPEELRRQGFDLEFVSADGAEEQYTLYQDQRAVATLFFTVKQNQTAGEEPVKTVYIGEENIGNLVESGMNLQFEGLDLLRALDGNAIERAFSEASYFDMRQEERRTRYEARYESTPNTGFWISSNMEMRTDKHQKLVSLQFTGR